MFDFRPGEHFSEEDSARFHALCLNDDAVQYWEQRHLETTPEGLPPQWTDALHPGFFSYRQPKEEGQKREGLPEKTACPSFYDHLIAAGIPEEAIVGNRDLWDFFRQAEANDVVSHNRTFYVTDKDGHGWLLKITDNPVKARIEAAYNYHLNSLGFIARGMAPEPFESGGLYMTLQERIVEDVRRPLEYWIACLASFHNSAKEMLESQGLEARTLSFYSTDHFEEQIGMSGISIPFDRVRIQESIDHLLHPDDVVLVHGDLKRGNLLGSYLVDGEAVALASPAVDLCLLFSQYAVPRDRWGHYLRMYLSAKGVEDVDEKVKDLEISMDSALVYKVTKEICGSSLRRETEKTCRDNSLLSSYLAA